MDLQSLTEMESAAEMHDFGREEAMALVDPHERQGVEDANDQLDALIADELFTA